MLTITNVTRRYPTGTIALQNASLTVAPGEFITLLGPSGCGKSTLLRLVAGLDEPNEGTVTTATPRNRIAYVFQDPTLLPWATAAVNVALPLRLRGQTDPTRVAAALDRVGLTGFAHARPRELSGGMRMRVSLARALVAEPALLLMDEPFAALDEFTRHTLQHDLRTLCRQQGCTVIFVTHSIYEAAYLATRIVLMSPRPGRIIHDIPSTVPETPERRLTPAYTALVADIAHAMRS